MLHVNVKLIPTQKTELEWKQMRWIDDAVQKGRDLGMGSETLLLVKTIRDVVSKQQEQDAIRRQKESEAPPTF